VLDNAVGESWFATLKEELIHANRGRPSHRFRRAVFEFVEVFPQPSAASQLAQLHDAVEYEQTRRSAPQGGSSRIINVSWRIGAIPLSSLHVSGTPPRTFRIAVCALVARVSREITSTARLGRTPSNLTHIAWHSAAELGEIAVGCEWKTPPAAITGSQKNGAFTRRRRAR